MTTNKPSKPEPAAKPSATSSMPGASGQRPSPPSHAPAVFAVTINKTGLVRVSDPQWMRKISQLEQRIQGLASHFASQVPVGQEVVLSIAKDGSVTSSNPNIVAASAGESASDLLTKFGGVSVEPVSVALESDGQITLSKADLFAQHPEALHLVEAAQTKAKDRVHKLGKGAKPLKFNVTQSGDVQGGDVAILTPSGSDGGGKVDRAGPRPTTAYQDFKACVGDWWFAIGINVPCCAILIAVDRLTS